MLKRLMIVVCLVVLAGFTVNTNTVQAEGIKIGVIDLQRVVFESAAGQKAQAVIKKRDQELKEKFKAEQQGLIALENEIKKKESAWSEEQKNTKIREYKLKAREFQIKMEDAQTEMRQLAQQEQEPILKQLDSVLKAFGEKNGYSLIVDSRMAFYSNGTLDISAAVKEELDKRLK